MLQRLFRRANKINACETEPAILEQLSSENSFDDNKEPVDQTPFIDINPSHCVCFVTHFGTVLTSSNDAILSHVQPLRSFKPLLGLNVKGGLWLIRETISGSYEYLVRDGVDGALCFSATLPPLLIEIGGSSEDGICLKSSGKILCCQPSGTAQFTATKARGWENLGLIARDSLDWFMNTTVEQWFEWESGNPVIFKRFRKEGANTYLDAEGLSYRLSGRPGPMILGSASPNRITILDSFRRRVDVVRFNPVIYFCVFGSDDYYECCQIAVTSLRRFGRYTGDIIIIADRTPEQVLSILPDDVRDRVLVRPVSGHEPLFERYKVFDHPISEYLPVMYLDTDIVVADDIRPLLKQAATRPGLHMYREAHEPLDDIKDTRWDIDANWWGSWMIGRSDSLADLPFWRATSGIMIFNDLHLIQSLFENVCMMARLTRRHEIDWFGDQPILNYLATQMEIIDISLLNGKSVNSAHADHFMARRKRFLMHVSIGVGKGYKKLPIMQELLRRLSVENAPTD